MKTIYTAITARLKEKVPAIRWIDFDKGQLDSTTRPSVAFPCALLTIAVDNASSITDYIQNCRGRVRVRLAFDQQMKTDSASWSLSGGRAEPKPEAEVPAILDKALEPYDVIAEVYAALQGFGTENFDALSRVRQSMENSRHGLFVYFIEFSVEFEDETAN